MNRGFTVVEVVVTLVVIMVIMTLSVVGMRGVQANARDTERSEDVASIARGLEQLYKTGGNGVSAGVYPSLNDLWNGVANANTYTWPSYAPGTSVASFTTPSGSYGLALICIFQSPSGYWSTQPGCETPGNETKIRSFISPDGYGYEPLNRTGDLCYGNDCASYTLYWINEVDGQLNKLKSLHR